MASTNTIGGPGASGTSNQGVSCAISGDATTLAIGGSTDNSYIGATWVFTQSGNIWSEQIKLVGTGATGLALQGTSCSISSDGNTLAVGGHRDNSFIGATWIFVRSEDVWTQQDKLVGSGSTSNSNQGISCSLSNDGNTLAVGALGDNNFIGATWIFNRSGSIWSQNIKLVGIDGIGATFQGASCALSGDGTMLAVGGDGDNTSNGATWIFVQSADVWTQQSKVVGKGNIGPAGQGTACSLSNNGSILAVEGIVIIVMLERVGYLNDLVVIGFNRLN